MDKITKEQRSKNMKAVKSKGTKEEVRLAKALWHRGHRYRKNDRTVFGIPDLVFKKYKVAIFVDSEFFHGKDWETKKKPQTNIEFWEKKISGNIKRDKEVNEYLFTKGWTVLRFWSNDVKKKLFTTVRKIETEIDEVRKRIYFE